MTEKILLTPLEAAAVLGIGRTKIYDLIRRGELESIRLDGCRRIPRTALEALVARLCRRASTDHSSDLPQARQDA